MAYNKLVRVEIVNAEGLGGSGWVRVSQAAGRPLTECNKTLETEIQELKETLEKVFPGSVKVEYVDLLDLPDKQKFVAGGLFFSGHRPPAVFINGKHMFTSEIPTEMIQKEVEKILNS